MEAAATPGWEPFRSPWIVKMMPAGRRSKLLTSCVKAFVMASLPHLLVPLLKLPGRNHGFCKIRRDPAGRSSRSFPPGENAGRRRELRAAGGARGRDYRAQRFGQ